MGKKKLKKKLNIKREVTAKIVPKKTIKIDVGLKTVSNELVGDNSLLRADLTKVFVLTMLAVGLEVVLKLLWK